MRSWRYLLLPVASVMAVLLVAAAVGILTYHTQLGESFSELLLPIGLLICSVGVLILSWMKLINRIVQRWDAEDQKESG